MFIPTHQWFSKMSIHDAKLWKPVRDNGDRMSGIEKAVKIKLGNIEYAWHNKNWITVYNNLTVSTSLAQKLTEMALKQKLLTKEDFVTDKKTK